ncbi:MAG: metallophosphoesterase [Desulfomonilia bacterium]
MKGIFSYPRKGISFILFLSLIFILQGCGGGGSSSSTGGSSTSGQALIGLTDAPGDFVHYQVDVTSLTLTKANGAVVETLPLKTSVDFAQLTDMTEFLTACTVPLGAYTKAVLTLDYSDANIVVENSAGAAVPVTSINILDDEGNTTPITQPVQVIVDLDVSSLTIAPGVLAHLSLDFDLAATNTVTLAADGNSASVTVTPILKADLQPDQDKIQRLRGSLQDVDVADNTFNIILRPFVQDLAVHETSFGVVKVTIDDSTVYNINNISYQGSSGLTVLSGLPAYTAVITHGQFVTNPLHFVATEVLAGSSVPGGTLDVAGGTVLSRLGDVLTLKGATMIRAGGSIVYKDKVQVTLGSGTKVSRQYSKDSFTKDDISVGQRVMVFGTLTNPGSGNLQLDATSGFARMLLTVLIGTVATDPLSNEELAVRLQSIDWRNIKNNKDIELFDFTGTGIDMAHNADPADYIIGASPLDLSPFTAGTPVKVLGFVSAFGTANPPTVPDFEAQTIIDVSDVPGLMNVGWGTGKKAALNFTDHGLTLDLTNTGFFHRINRMGVLTDLESLPVTTPEIVPSTDSSARFRIDQGGVSQVYSTFSSFETDLQRKITAGSKIKHIYAWGMFNNTTATLTSEYIIVKLTS